MSPLGLLDPLDDTLTRRRLVAAAAAHGWAVGPVAWDADGPCRSVGYPREVVHPGGRAVLPSRPVRPFAARTLAEFDTLLALGVVPAGVGSRGGDGAASWRSVAAEADIPVVDLDDPVAAARRLAGLRVDLVVVSTAVAAAARPEMTAYRELGVPVVELPSDDVDEQLRIAGAALDLDTRAARLAAEARRRWAGADLGPLPRSVAAFSRDGIDGAHLLTGASALGTLLRRCGLPEPAGSAPGAGPLVRAQLSDLDVDLLIGLELEAGMLGPVEAHRRCRELPAVRRGRYRRLDPAASYAVCVPSVLTVGLAVSVLESVLAVP